MLFLSTLRDIIIQLEKELRDFSNKEAIIQFNYLTINWVPTALYKAQAWVGKGLQVMAQVLPWSNSGFILKVASMVFTDGWTGYECEKWGVNNDPKIFHLGDQKFKVGLTEMRKTRDWIGGARNKSKSSYLDASSLSCLLVEMSGTQLYVRFTGGKVQAEDINLT